MHRTQVSPDRVSRLARMLGHKVVTAAAASAAAALLFGALTAEADYIPARDADLRAWVVNFDTLITATPTDYGLVAGDATAIHTVVDAFTDALDVITNPATRTTPAIADKDVKKAAMLIVVRQYAQQVRNDVAVSDELKLGLGINIPDPSRTPVPVPVTQPLLNVIAATPGVLTVRFADALSPDSRSKPDGAAGLQLFTAVGTTATEDPETAQFSGVFTAQPIALPFDAADAGKIASLFARWMNAKGEVGPWSNGTTFRIA